MLPIQLTLQGINSYQQKVVIEFDKLIEGQLFGIFGPVGSGKSTILEAITLALYGETEKLNKAGDNRHYNLMNLRSDSLLVDFLFQAGKNQDTYRCFYQTKRHRSRHEEVRPPVHKAYIKKGGEWAPCTLKDIEDAIGLNYGNFRRTIIIPQGKFEEFLQLSPSERTRMMKTIFGLEAYELYPKAKKIKTQADLDFKELQGRLLELPDFTQEQLSALKQQIKTLQQKEQKQTKQLETAKNLGEILQKRENFREQEVQIATKVKSLKQELDQKNENINKVNDLFKKLQEEFKTIDQQKSTNSELVALVNFKKTSKKLNKSREQENELSKKLNAIDHQLQEVQAPLTALIEEKTALLLNQPDFDSLNPVKNWIEEEKHFINQHLKLQEEAIQKQEQLTHFLTDTWKDLFKPEHQIQSFPTAYSFLGKQKTTTEIEIEKIQKEVEHLQVQAKLQGLVRELESGKPCPVCGSIDHPEVINITMVDQQLTYFKEQLQQQKKRLNKIAKWEIKLSKAESSYQSKVTQLEELKSKIKQQAHTVKSHQKKFPKSTFKIDDLEDFENIYQRAIDQQKTIKKLHLQIQEKEKTLQHIKDEKSELEKKISHIQQESFTISGALTQLKSSISTKVWKSYETTPESALTEQIENAQKNILRIEQAFHNTQTKLHQLENEKHQLTGQIKTSEERTLELTQQLKTIEKHWKNAIRESKLENFNDYLETPPAFLDWQKMVTLEEKAVQETRIELQSKISEQQRIIETIDKRKVLLSKQKNLNNRIDHLNTLLNLFKGSGFVDFISGIYLRELCDLANHRFLKLTRHQMRLEINEKNQFIVRDFLNEGKTRSVKTLSGGQLFQASLSLALALAENIRYKNGAKDQFFFLDEGFGTQDEVSLQLILNTLKSLRQEGRAVGIISHLNQLKDEIDVYLSVENDQQKGSIVKTN